MKAYHILMFIYILSIVITMVQTVGFYTIPTENNLEYDPLGADETVTYNVGSSEGLIATLITGFAISIGMVVLINRVNPLNRSSSDLQVAGITFFATTFWGFYLTIWNNITTLFYATAELQGYIIAIFTGLTLIVIIVYGIGLYQMLTGGWKSFE